jgi:hypothetical protein
MKNQTVTYLSLVAAGYIKNVEMNLVSKDAIIKTALELMANYSQFKMFILLGYATEKKINVADPGDVMVELRHYIIDLTDEQLLELA